MRRAVRVGDAAGRADWRRSGPGCAASHSHNWDRASARDCDPCPPTSRRTRAARRCAGCRTIESRRARSYARHAARPGSTAGRSRPPRPARGHGARPHRPGRGHARCQAARCAVFPCSRPDSGRESPADRTAGGAEPFRSWWQLDFELRASRPEADRVALGRIGKLQGFLVTDRTKPAAARQQHCQAGEQDARDVTVHPAAAAQRCWRQDLHGHPFTPGSGYSMMKP